MSSRRAPTGCLRRAVSLGRSGTDRRVERSARIGRLPDRHRVARQPRELARCRPLHSVERVRAHRRHPGVRLISLQKQSGRRADRSSAVWRPDRARHGRVRQERRRAAGDGRRLANLDMVVTSNSMMAHLAGALGRPTFVALRRVPDWRWLLDRDDSPFYPTARLFRQKTEGDWASGIRADRRCGPGVAGSHGNDLSAARADVRPPSATPAPRAARPRCPRSTSARRSPGAGAPHPGCPASPRD